MKPVISETINFLIVDDTPENLVALQALLRRPGLTILTARSGSEALELLLSHEVALAILDVQMPGMDGFELAELMRGALRTKQVPIIFVTAGASDPHRAFKGYESGAVDFLFKPIEPSILKSKADVFFELYRQRRDLENSLRLNEMFVGILGHDLRSPLGTIINGSRLLEYECSSEEGRRALSRMIAAGERMAGMLTQMLDLTRARLGGGVVGPKRPLDVAHLIQTVVDEVATNHPGREMIVRCKGTTGVAADAGRLLQVFSNLVINAVNHGSSDAPVMISLTGGEDEVVVCVSNAGAIPADLLPTIFDPFRSGRSTSSRTSGLGLGLYISKQIMIGHGGSLEVETGTDCGTAFTARIPRQ